MSEDSLPPVQQRSTYARLEVVDGPGQGTSFALSHRVETVGRTKNCTIKPEDKEISRRHAQIEHRPDGLWVTDLDSTNGTFVNGSRVYEPYCLVDSDEIKMGASTFILTLVKSPPVAEGEAVPDINQTALIEPPLFTEPELSDEPETAVDLSQYLSATRNVFRLRMSVREGQTQLAALSLAKGRINAILERPYSDVEQSELLEELQKKSRMSFVEVAWVQMMHGHRLYNALLPSSGQPAADILEAFSEVIDAAHEQHMPLMLQLWFDHGAVNEAQLPWELIHDGTRHLVLAEALHLNRYITYFGERESFEPVDELRILYIISRPTDLEDLPHYAERNLMYEALQGQIKKGKVQIDVLEDATFSNFRTRLQTARAEGRPYHIVHFDGHGGYSAGQQIGVLCFEDAGERTDLVTSKQLSRALQGTGVRLVMLSACQSGTVGGQSVLNSVGPALIRARVPAVIAMQFAISMQATMTFTAEFYSSVARGESVAAAVANGRRAIAGGDVASASWFFPALYLRAADGEGYLFSAEPEEHAMLRQIDMARLVNEWNQMTPEEQAAYEEGPLGTEDIDEILEIAEHIMEVTENLVDVAEQLGEIMESEPEEQEQGEEEPRDQDDQQEQEQEPPPEEPSDETSEDERKRLKEELQEKAEKIIGEAREKRKSHEERLAKAKEGRKPYEKALREAEEGHRQHQEAYDSAMAGYAQHEGNIANAMARHQPYQEAIDRTIAGHQPYQEAIDRAIANHQPYQEAVDRAIASHQPYQEAINQAMASGNWDVINAAQDASNRYWNQNVVTAQNASNAYWNENVATAQNASNRYWNENVATAQNEANRYWNENVVPAQNAANEYWAHTVEPAREALHKYDTEVFYPAQQELYQYDTEVVRPAENELQQFDWQVLQPAEARAEQLRAQAGQVDHLPDEQVRLLKQSMDTE